ncbi:MAG: hypothetical protein IPH28_24235 [Cytophagaceae bacterium]|nr:hypothetical protein [Cytophagaceae bacterium]
MKNILSLIAFLSFFNFASGQSTNQNTMSVKIDGTEYNTQPRQIRFGAYAYFTGNATKPDRMLRIWVGNFYGTDNTEEGDYLIVNADNPDTKENIKRAQDFGKFKGIAAIRYVEETRTPRMEYHVGDSKNNDEVLTLKIGKDGFLEFKFYSQLEGTYWKEKATATAFGGLGRIKDKIESKVITQATGFDNNIDPEGNGYKRQDKKDVIELTEGIMRFKK